MGPDDLLTLRDSLNITKIDDKSDLKSAVWALSDEYEIRWVSRLGGYCAVLIRDPETWFPLCPVRGCKDYSAGSHYCVHIEDYWKAKMEQERAQDRKPEKEWIDVDRRDDKSVDYRKPFFNKLTRRRQKPTELDDHDDDFKQAPKKILAKPTTPPTEMVKWNLRPSTSSSCDVVALATPSPVRLFRDGVNKKDIKTLFSNMCKDRALDFQSLFAEDNHAKLLKSIGSREYKNEEFTVTRQGLGSSFRVKRKDGFYFFTCGDPECFSSDAEFLVGATFYCPEHKNRKKVNSERRSTVGMETINVYIDAMKTLAAKLDGKYSAKGNKLIGPETWARVLAHIHKNGKYQHEIGSNFVTIKVSKEGQLTYMNMNRDRNVFKCGFNDCYKTNEVKREVKESASKHFIFPEHKDHYPEYLSMMRTFQELIGKKSPITISH